MLNITLADLRKDATLFHLLVESVQDYAIYALDPGGHIVSWNPGVQLIKGYAPDEVLGRHFSMFFPEEDRASGRPARLLEQAAQHGRVEDEAWRVRKDGRRFWANVVITAIRGQDGELVGFAKVTRDLTERRAAEQALRLRERQLRDTQTLAGLGSWEWDIGADRVTWSDELYRIYGLEPQSFGATFAAYLDCVHPADRDRVRAEVERAYAEGSSFEFDERIVRPDGDIRMLASRGRAVRDDSGTTTHLIGACLDVTDLKRAEQQAVEFARVQSARDAAEASAQGLRFLVRASEVLASSLDYEATLRNLAALAVPDIADWCAVDLVEDDGTLKRVAVAHSDPAKVELAKRYVERYPARREDEGGAWRVIETGEPGYFPEISDEMLAASIDDPVKLEMLRALGLRSALTVPLAGREGVLGALTLVQAESNRQLTPNDVELARELGRHAALAIENARLHFELMERTRQLEDQSGELEIQAEELQVQTIQREQLLAELEATNEALLLRTAEAEHANLAKSQFLATMSHELRTPLNAIIGFSDLLDAEIAGPLTAAQRTQLGRIGVGARHLLQLIEEILAFSRIEAGREEVQSARVDLADIVRETAALIEPLATARSLEFFCSVPDTVDIVTDAAKVRQILINLLANAVKFTDTGHIALEVREDAGEVLLFVRDSGIGIPPEHHELIFEPFSQVEQAPNRRPEGTGLGLAVSRHLARLLGGDVTVSSVAGRGSTFVVRLPAS